jgi:hypothetical protein
MTHSCRPCRVIRNGHFSPPLIAVPSPAQSLGSTQVVARNLLDKMDDTSPHACLLYLHERLGEREPVGGGEEIENVGR